MRREEAKAGAWDGVRRALARLVTHPQVREVAGADRELPVEVRATEALGTLSVLRGAGEAAWRPAAALQVVPIPQARAGDRDRDLLPTVQVALKNQSIAAPDCRSLPPMGAADCRVEAIGLVQSLETIGLPAAFLSLPSSPIRVQSRPLLSLPPNKAWPVPRVKAPKMGELRISKPSPPRVRGAGDAFLGRLALTRWSRETAGLPPDAAFVTERLRLAEAAGLALEDVSLLGIYDSVPILAVSRIVVEDEGRRLRLWLKPDVLHGKGRARLITLLVGRRLSDGKMLQAAL